MDLVKRGDSLPYSGAYRLPSADLAGLAATAHDDTSFFRVIQQAQRHSEAMKTSRTQTRSIQCRIIFSIGDNCQTLHSDPTGPPFFIAFLGLVGGLF